MLTAAHNAIPHDHVGRASRARPSASRPTHARPATLLLLTLALASVLPFLAPTRAQADTPGRWRVVEQGAFRVATTESPAEARRFIATLTDLRSEFETEFAALLVPTAAAARPIEVALFSDPNDFRAYARRVAPALVDSSGFYCAAENRLAILSQRLPAVHADFTAPATVAPAFPRSPGAIVARPVVSGAAGGAGCRATEHIVRHEGAHQLFAHYQIHSRYALEPTWLTEGLAEYCAPDRVGAIHEAHRLRLRELRRADALPPLRQLLNHREADGFLALGRAQAEIAYVQSWALASFLMRAPRREPFFELLRLYRDADPARARVIEDTEPAELLLRHLGTDLATLEADWRRFLETL